MRFASLNQWLSWQEQLHPSEIELGLDRVAAVLQRMELGDLKFSIISVAGTNGKGSCVAMLEAIYRAAGYSVGSYTSPHIKSYNERITINGVSVSDAQLCEVFETIDQSRGEISLTYFEFGTLAAIALMVEADVDIAILEVGLGGRLDAVNVLDSDVAVISSIGMDHQDWLGDDREKIAMEKIGIARSGRPVVCGELDPPLAIKQHCEKIGAHFFQINKDYSFEISVSNDAPGWHWEDSQRKRSNLPYPALRGSVQLQNAATVLKAIEALNDSHPVSQANIRDGLSEAYIPGRFQVIPGGLPGDVTTIVDVAHNVQAVKAFADALKSLPCNGSTIAVFSCLMDKDLDGIIAEIITMVDRWYVADLDVPRARPVSDITDAIVQQQSNAKVTVCPSIGLAKESAMLAAQPGDRIVIFGSFYVVGDLL